MNVTFSYYVRKSEAQKVFGSHFNQMTPTEAVPATEGVAKQPLGTATNGFNFVTLSNVAEGLSAVDYKFESRGEQYFLSVTFSNEGEQPRENVETYADAICAVANDLNSRWQTAKYIIGEGRVNICSRERMNTTKKDGSVIKMVPVR